MPSTFLRDALFSHIIKPPFEWSSRETHSPEILPRSSGRACCCSSKVDLSLFKDHVTEIIPGACRAPLAAKATPSLSVGICSTGTWEHQESSSVAGLGLIFWKWAATLLCTLTTVITHECIWILETEKLFQIWGVTVYYILAYCGDGKNWK